MLSSESPGPRTPASIATFQHKYCQRGETFRDVCNRVSSSLSDNSQHYKQMRSIMLEGRFWPGGRILSSIGTTKRTTPYNCFVSGPIRDSYVSGQGHIMQRATEAAATMRMGGGIGYDFSTLRPRGDRVTKIDGFATGPVSFLDIFNSVGKCTSSTGERRGAQMAMLRVDHPDIEEFIRAKQNTTIFNAFNMSVAITDEFMHAVMTGGLFDLQFGGKVYRTINADVLWEAIMRSTWDWGEPGVVFIDRINKQNNLAYCETIAATNPCSEQPLPPFGACLLGYFNLTKYLMSNGRPSGIKDRYKFDRAQFAADIPVVVRAMDNVVDEAIYPLPEQEDSAKQTRRMGLGVMGVANTLEALGLTYGSPECIAEMESILTILKNEAYFASSTLAAEKGAFPLYQQEAYLDAPFIKGLSDPVRASIVQHGIRNSHLTSIAPTGTTSFCADNVSGGIEPVFDYKYKRKVITPEGTVEYVVEDYGYAVLGVEGRRAMQVSAQEHIDMLTAAQKHVDSAISKTCNVSSSMEWEDFKDIYIRAYKGGAKSCSTFQNEGGKREGVMKPIADCENGVCAA